MAGKEADSVVQHPFTPAALLIPDYVPNSRSGLELGVLYSGPVFVVFILTFTIFRKDCHGKGLAVTERLLMGWFGVCALTHLTLEAAFLLLGKSIAWREDFFSQMWKEWSLADSRYVTQHAGIYSIKAVIVVFDCPVCLLVLWMTYFRSPGRYAAEMIVSSFHLYGTIVYFLEAHFSDYHHIAVNDPFLLWAYFVGCNSPWFIMPILVIIRDVRHIASSQSLSDSVAGKQTKKGR